MQNAARFHPDRTIWGRRNKTFDEFPGSTGRLVARASNPVFRNNLILLGARPILLASALKDLGF
jgi:hypothetical protein